MRKIGLQLYTVRETAKKDFIGTLKEVAAIGYAGVEGGGYLGDLPARELRKVLDDLGLNFVSGHISMDNIKGGFEDLIETYVTLGAKYIGLAWIGEEWRKTAADWQRAARTMEEASMLCQKSDLTFFYHNHAFEFEKFDGKYGFDILFDAADPVLVKSEMDAYWVTKGGADAITYINKYAGRVPLLHIKDMTKDAAKTFEIIGEGSLDFDAIMAAGDKAGVDWYLVEQDQCPQGELVSVRKSYENIVSRGWLGS